MLSVRRFKIQLAMTTALTALGAASPGLAQSEPVAANAAPPLALEEVVVTADRRNSFGNDFLQAGSFRNSRVIDTPLTVSVIPQELIQAQQAMTLLDALKNTAGVTTAQINAAVYNNLAIRGITVENRGNYRLNGVLPIINLVDLPLEDKDRVEALKGASALYYGFTTPAGIINLTTKRPTKSPLAEVDVFGNSHGALGAHVDLSRTFDTSVGQVGVRLNALQSSVETGIDKTEGNRHFVSGAIDWKPTEKLLLQFDAEDIYKTVTEPAEIQLPAATNGVIVIPSLQVPSKNLGGKWMYGSGEEYNLLAHAQYSFSPTWSASAYVGESHLIRNRRYSAFGNYNLTTGAGTLTTTLTNGNEYKNLTYRGEVAGVIQTGPFVHELVFGASENDRTSLVPTNPSVKFAQNLYNPVDIPDVALPARVIPNPSRITDIGYYIFDKIKYQDWLQLLVGYRKADYTDASRTLNYNIKPGSASYGIVVKPRKWISLYATYIEGLEEGSVAPATATNANQTLPANPSTQREYGLKFEPIKHLLFTVAHFDIDRASAFLNTSNTFVQDGRASYKGYEFSLTGEITPDLSIYASALTLDAKQASGSTALVTGKRLENTAKDTESVSFEYRVPIAALDGLNFTAGIFHVGDRAVNAANNAFVPGYTLFDLGASYMTSAFDHPVTLRVNGENVGNKRYWAATGSSLLAEGLPSLVKFSVSTRF